VKYLFIGVPERPGGADPLVCGGPPGPPVEWFTEAGRGARRRPGGLPHNCSAHSHKLRTEAGVTLIELLVAITLVALLSSSLLLAMRTGFMTFSKTGDRLRANRRQLNIEKILASEVSGAMPVAGPCGSVFNGNPTALRLVSSYSIAEGSRGLPRIVELQVAPGSRGGYRLVVNEYLYTGPSSTLPFCANAPVLVTPASFVAADGLAFCRFSYRVGVVDTVLPGDWIPVWDRPNLPGAVRIDMAPLHTGPGELAALPVTVPIRITREVRAQYDDSQ
jgi:prepilin-type N-terminal cleavage/methylation domain-containing protein